MPLIPGFGRGKGRLISELESSLGFLERAPGQLRLGSADWADGEATAPQKPVMNSPAGRGCYFIQLNKEADNWHGRNILCEEQSL